MTQSYCMVPTKQALYTLQNHVEGECIYCEEDGKIYSWQENDGWQPIEFDNKGISMNLYDLNKNIINQLKTMEISEIKENKKLFNELYDKTNNIHYMLLCKDYNYYTIFKRLPENLPSFADIVVEVISELGEVKSIEFTETQDAIEIWIQPTNEEETYVFYLFPYDAGVVYYG